MSCRNLWQELEVPVPLTNNAEDQQEFHTKVHITQNNYTVFMNLKLEGEENSGIP
jgi:hypothetical protein